MTHTFKKELHTEVDLFLEKWKLKRDLIKTIESVNGIVTSCQTDDTEIQADLISMGLVEQND